MLRALLAEERKIIREAKKFANNEIKKHRKKIRKGEPYDYKAKIESLTLVKGYPVIVKRVGGGGAATVCIDWALVRKLRLNSEYSVDCDVKPGALVINYSKAGMRGTIELFELPKHQVEQLQNRVPVIFI